MKYSVATKNHNTVTHSRTYKDDLRDASEQLSPVYHNFGACAPEPTCHAH